MLGGMSSYFAQVIPLHLDYLRNGRDSPGGSGDVALIPRCRMKIPHAVEELSPLRPDAAKLKKKKKERNGESTLLREPDTGPARNTYHMACMYVGGRRGLLTGVQLYDLMILSANKKFRNRLATNRSCLKSFWKRSEGREKITVCLQ